MLGLREVVSCLAMSALLGCGLDSHVIGEDPRQAGGSGSEAGNSLHVTARLASGAPASGARVEIWRPDSVTQRPSYQAMTNAQGEAEVRVADGEWSVVVRQEGLAFRKVVQDSGRLQDTLRPMASLAGIVSGGAGQIVSIPGVGRRAVCDTHGYFRVDSLPSGSLPVEVGSESQKARSVVSLTSGSQGMVLARRDSIPSLWPSLRADSLIAWAPNPPPAILPRGGLGEFEDFAVAVRFRRLDTTTPVQVLSWTDGGSRGVKIGWRGSEAMLLTVDGRTMVAMGVPLDTGSQQLGMSWDARTLRVYLGADLLLEYAYATADVRSDWSAPVFGAQGIERIDWIAFQRGLLTKDWLIKLSAL